MSMGAKDPSGGGGGFPRARTEGGVPVQHQARKTV